MAWRSYLFICTLHYLIIIIMHTCLKVFNIHNACQVYSIKCVSKVYDSGNYFMQYMGPCVFRLCISLVMIVRICILDFIIIKSWIWLIGHSLGLGHEIMVCTLYLAMFLAFHTSFTWSTHPLKKKQIINLTTLSSLTTFITTFYGDISDEKVIKLTIFCF